MLGYPPDPQPHPHPVPWLPQPRRDARRPARLRRRRCGRSLAATFIGMVCRLPDADAVAAVVYTDAGSTTGGPRTPGSSVRSSAVPTRAASGSPTRWSSPPTRGVPILGLPPADDLLTLWTTSPLAEHSGDGDRPRRGASGLRPTEGDQRVGALRRSTVRSRSSAGRMPHPAVPADTAPPRRVRALRPRVRPMRPRRSGRGDRRAVPTARPSAQSPRSPTQPHRPARTRCRLHSR